MKIRTTLLASMFVASAAVSYPALAQAQTNSVGADSTTTNVDQGANKAVDSQDNGTAMTPGTDSMKPAGSAENSVGGNSNTSNVDQGANKAVDSQDNDTAMKPNAMKQKPVGSDENEIGANSNIGNVDRGTNKDAN